MGHDWGSAVAWAFAGLYPERTLQLVGISVGHPSGYQKGEHKGAQKEKSWCVKYAQCLMMACSLSHVTPCGLLVRLMMRLMHFSM